MYKIRYIVLLLIIFLCSAQNIFAQDVEKHQTEEGIKYGLWNVKVGKPAPALIILSATVDESLGDPYFRQCGNQLAKHGFLSISVDLPSHGEFSVKGKPANLRGWSQSCKQNENFVIGVVNRISKVLDHLIEKRIIDPKKIAVCGTSRGGFIAFHLAASDPRIECVAAYAPVTELLALKEFKGMDKNSMMKKLSAINLVNRLSGKKLWLIIGDRDDRVGTDDSIKFIRAVTKLSLKKNQPALAELHVVPEPIAHTTPAGSPELSAKWILKQLNIEK